MKTAANFIILNDSAEVVSKERLGPTNR